MQPLQEPNIAPGKRRCERCGKWRTFGRFDSAAEGSAWVARESRLTPWYIDPWCQEKIKREDR